MTDQEQALVRMMASMRKELGRKYRVGWGTWVFVCFLMGIASAAGLEGLHPDSELSGWGSVLLMLRTTAIFGAACGIGHLIAFSVLIMIYGAEDPLDDTERRQWVFLLKRAQADLDRIIWQAQQYNRAVAALKQRITEATDVPSADTTNNKEKGGQQ